MHSRQRHKVEAVGWSMEGGKGTARVLVLKTGRRPGFFFKQCCDSTACRLLRESHCCRCCVHCCLAFLSKEHFVMMRAASLGLPGPGYPWAQGPGPKQPAYGAVLSGCR